MARFSPSLLQRACSSQPQTPAKQQMASGAATELISVAQRTDILHQKRGRSPLPGEIWLHLVKIASKVF
jgi:hypothetical protein